MSGTGARWESRASRVSGRLRVDPVACDGIGMCAHLAPRIIALGPWGYPVLAAHPLAPADARRAAAAVAACPRRALFVQDHGGSGSGGGAGPVEGASRRAGA